MEPAKDTVRALLDELPDDCTLEDVLYHLYVIQNVQAGLADVDANRTIPHKAVVAELRQKWVIGNEQ
jgi:predicted transcriptional regulator